jgi:hypothetical protein
MRTREYLQFALERPLESGRRYRLSFRVSAAENSGYITDRVGAIFSAVDRRKGLPPGLRERAQVENPLGRMLGDTAGWMQVSGIHNAQGGERFVIIGNFHPCNSSTRVRMHGSKKAALQLKTKARLDPVARRGAWHEWMARTAYVYLDDVSLLPDSTAPERIAALSAAEACPLTVPTATGPELVPDPGFDQNVHPTPTSWRNASNGTPDLFNGVLGLYLYSAAFKDNREYVRTPLNTPLSPCNTYRISMDVRRDPSYAFVVDAIGIALVDTFSTPYDRLVLDLPWAWRSPPGALLVNSDRPMTLCGTFTPAGCAQQLLLGNFGADSATTIVRDGSAQDGPYAYVFVDNVHLVHISTADGCIDPCSGPIVLEQAVQPFTWPERISLHFDSNTNVPLEVDAAALVQLASRLVEVPQLQLHITGHTDSVGNTAENERLGLARADHLRRMLLDLGAPPHSIHTHTRGSSAPVADNATEEGRALNRRVDVELRK